MDQFKKKIIEIISKESPKPWESFSDETILDAIATLKMGCDLHQDEFYHNVGERIDEAKPIASSKEAG